MGTAITSLMFLLMLMGIIISYPAYFYSLYRFKVLLARDHPDLWAAKLASAGFYGQLQVAYKALRQVGEGKLDGIALTERVSSSHRVTTRLLYAGMLFFMAFLFNGLYYSVWGSGGKLH